MEGIAVTGKDGEVFGTSKVSLIWKSEWEP